MAAACPKCGNRMLVYTTRRRADCTTRYLECTNPKCLNTAKTEERIVAGDPPPRFTKARQKLTVSPEARAEALARLDAHAHERQAARLSASIPLAS